MALVNGEVENDIKKEATSMVVVAVEIMFIVM